MNLKEKDKVRMISHESAVSFNDIGEIIEILEETTALVKWENFSNGWNGKHHWYVSIKKLEKLSNQLELEF